MVGRRHQREAGASQSTGWGCQEIPDRICGTLSSRRSSANHQQSLRTQEPAANHNQHALGALLSRGTASQSLIHTGCVHNLRKELDCPTLGQSATRTSQNCRGRALATGDRSGGWNQSQNQVCDVGFVFARRSVGVLWPQSHIFRDTGRELEASEARAPAYGSAPNVRDPPWFCHRNRSSSGWQNWSFGISCSCF